MAGSRTGSEPLDPPTTGDRVAELGLPSAWEVRPFADVWPDLLWYSLLFTAIPALSGPWGPVLVHVAVLPVLLALLLGITWLVGLRRRGRIGRILQTGPEHVVDGAFDSNRGMGFARAVLVFGESDPPAYRKLPLRARSQSCPVVGPVRVIGDLTARSWAVPVVDGHALWPVGRIRRSRQARRPQSPPPPLPASDVAGAVDIAEVRAHLADSPQWTTVLLDPVEPGSRVVSVLEVKTRMPIGDAWLPAALGELDADQTASQTLTASGRRLLYSDGWPAVLVAESGVLVPITVPGPRDGSATGSPVAMG